jgi:tRNA A22 N-methylase
VRELALEAVAQHVGDVPGRGYRVVFEGTAGDRGREQGIDVASLMMRTGDQLGNVVLAGIGGVLLPPVLAEQGPQLARMLR